jgi:hypothetical protein
MAPERLVLCGGAEPSGGAGSDPEPVRLWLSGPHRNVHRHLDDVLASMYTEVPAVFLDLIDLACYVYAADQAIVRGGGGVADCGDAWRRNLVFHVPVREPDFWRADPVRDALVSALSFLSEDEYRFEFAPLDEPINLLLDCGGTAFDGYVEDVVMFSGGLDSLAGAVQETVTDRRKVLLLNHRSTDKVVPRHEALLAGLAGHAGDARPHHVRVRVNKDKPLGRAFTQRPRSFLFAALGATFATMIGLNRLRFYENGVVSLNLPLSAQVVGARASRTTHPRVLAEFGRLVSLLTGKPFRVENRFLWATKADVVRTIAAAGCGDLIGRSTSCGHTWELTRQHTHCGRCSQCVDRRVAVLAAEQEAHDPGDAYGVDLLTGARPKGQDRVLLAAYLETANQVERMTDLQFVTRFGGELSRAVPFIGGPPEEAARGVLDLYRRHARDVTGVVDRAIAEHRRAIRRRELPDTCLVRLVTDGGADAAAQPGADAAGVRLTDSAAAYSFRRSGMAWVYRFAGGEPTVLLPSKGACYLHRLLSQPGACPSAVDLALQAARRPDRRGLGDAGERLDRESLSAYHVRIAELREEEAEAERNNDPGTLDRVRAELEPLLDELRAAVGAGGRLRRVAEDRERVRKAVRNAIGRAIDDIADFDRPFADHLRRHVQCGRNLCYNPEREVRWET